MRMPLQIVSFAAALLLIGAGCAPATAPNANSSDDQDEVSADVEADGEASVDTDDESEDDSDDAKDEGDTKTDDAQVDASWQTYSNAALGFEFKWPTKGIYAPRWAVGFEKEGSATIDGGCYKDGGTKRTVTLNGRTYCHTSTRTATNSTDRYVTKVGTTYVVLTFTKTVEASLVSSFSWSEYQAQLDVIAGTFVKK